MCTRWLVGDVSQWLTADLLIEAVGSCGVPQVSFPGYHLPPSRSSAVRYGPLPGSSRLSGRVQDCLRAGPLLSGRAVIALTRSTLDHLDPPLVSPGRVVCRGVPVVPDLGYREVLLVSECSESVATALLHA